MRHSRPAIRAVRGFTLTEILMVVAIFALAMLIATNIFLLVSQSQRRATSQQKLQGDVRFALETMARDIRFGAIDYSCYDGSAVCGEPTSGAATLTGGKTPLLALIDADGNKKRYKMITESATGLKKLYTCTINAAEAEASTFCNVSLENWEIVTAEGIHVSDISFYIAPFDDPFQPCDMVSVPEHRCVSSGSPYDADEQPRVTIVFRTLQDVNELVPESISQQTTVVTRYYPR